jgi:parallel beta-helix repeat protein
MNRQAAPPSTTLRKVARVLIGLAMTVICSVAAPLPVSAATIHKSGTITSDETWTSDNVYVINSDLTINNGATVTIQAGTVVKLETYSDIIVNGVLDAQGTSLNPVVFTSYRDDTYGGDTNGDGAATSPAPGNWGYIRLNNAANTLQYTRIRYGGYSNGAVYNTSSAIIAHNVIEYNSGQGIHSASGNPTIEYNEISHSGTGVYVTGGTPTIDHNTITENTDGLVTSNASPVVTNNTITNNAHFPLGTWGTSSPTFSGNTISGNGYQAVSVQGTITADTTWQNVQGLDLVYWVTSDVTVNAGATGVKLTIPAGTVVKLYTYSDIIVNGVLDVQGTSSNPVVFTSYQDDTYGGDTNGDGAATSPAPGNWGRIQFTNPSVHSALQYVIVRYGGYGGPMVGSNGSYLTVQHALLEYSSNDGLYIYHASDDPDVTVRYCTFRLNNGSGVRVGP